MNGRVRTLLAAGVAVAALAGCGGPSKPNVTVRVDKASLAVLPGSINEGKVKIDVDNSDTVDHELLILRTSDPSKVPVTADGNIDTAKVSIADSAKDFGSGRFRIVSPNLIAGTYVVTSSVVTMGPDGKPVHKYNPAMAAKLTVRPVAD